MRLQERRAAGSRDEILSATRRVLAEVGAPKLTLELVARELGITKQALYHYYPSKHALLFEIVYAELAAVAEAVHAACEAAPDGASAVEGVIRAYVAYFAPRLDAYRLVMLQIQGLEPDAASPDMLARIHPLNDRMFGVATDKLVAKRRGKRADRLAARRMVFAAYLAAQGLLTMKALVERMGDPLRYGDDELVDELCRAFRARAEKEGYA